LTVLTEALVTRITFEGRRATGVEISYQGQAQQIRASHEVVLSLGQSTRRRCCGTAGTYGYKREKYDIAMSVGDKLFRDIRATSPELSICDSETCRWQIVHGTQLPSVHPVELLARARVLLRRGQPTPEKLLVGDLGLDCIRRKVTRNSEIIELAPKEFSILEYLMRNRGRPLSRTMIVEHVWDMDYDGLTNIVDVYIRHLRSKIDDKYPMKMIHTVRGIGYMLDTPEKAGEKQVEP